MLEIVEVNVLADQINRTITGKQIVNVLAAASPHKFAFFHGDPQSYVEMLNGRRIEKAAPNGGQLEIKAEGTKLVLGDGVALRYHEPAGKRPAKHQLLLEFEDGSALSASVQMYGFLWCFQGEEFDNPYYLVAKRKPSPLTEAFDRDYFNNLLSSTAIDKLSAKAFLATEQRIPGIGNGVLQDILLNAGIHPKRKISTLTSIDKDKLFTSLKETLSEMIQKGGRDTEKDLFGMGGGYQTKLSKNTVNKPCPVCGEFIQKEAYLGGSIYYCSGCQL